MHQPIELIISCEHGGNRIPARYAKEFKPARWLLNTHCGLDPGALELARKISRSLRVPLHSSQTSRLLVDLNRSVGHPKLFSRYTKSLTPVQQEELLHRHYFPYRNEVEQCISRATARGRTVLHLSVHSFTPIFHGVRRKTDIGLLFDPSRVAERRFAKRWKEAIHVTNPRWNVRLNSPYLGVSDGFIPYLRRRFRPGKYAGIEIEVNQKFHRAGGKSWMHTMDALNSTFCDITAPLL